VLLVQEGISLSEIEKELADRHSKQKD